MSRTICWSTVVPGKVSAFAPLADGVGGTGDARQSMPGYSVVRVEVEGKSDVPVYIWKEGWEGMMKRSGSNATNPFSLEFSPLGPGTYMIEPDRLNVWTDVELTGLEAVWITFRPRSTPASPNRIARIAPVARTGDAPARVPMERSTWSTPAPQPTFAAPPQAAAPVASNEYAPPPLESQTPVTASRPKTDVLPAPLANPRVATPPVAQTPAPVHAGPLLRLWQISRN